LECTICRKQCEGITAKREKVVMTGKAKYGMDFSYEII